MGPVRVKLYGLFPMTKPTYLMIQCVGLVFLVAMMAVGIGTMLWAGAILPRLPPQGGDAGQDLNMVVQALGLLFWIGLLTLIAECIETYVVLRKFTRAEAEQRAELLAIDAGRAAERPADIQRPPEEPPITNVQP